MESFTRGALAVMCCRRWPSVVFCAIVAAITFTGYRVGSAYLQADAAFRLLSIEESSLDFGTAWLRSDFSHELSIQNTGASEVNIAGFSNSCGCVAVEPRALAIPPHGTRRIKLRLDLRTAFRRDDPAWQAPFSVVIRPLLLDAPMVGMGWTVRGGVNRPMRADVAELSFADSLVRGRPFAARSVVVHCRDARARVMARCEEGVARVTVDAAGSAAQRDFVVTVAPADTLPAGRNIFDLFLSTRLPSGETTPEVALPVFATVVEPLHALPPAVLLGPVDVGAAVEETVVLASRVAGQPRILECAADDASVQASPVRDAKAVALRLVVKAGREGIVRQELRVKADAGEGTEAVDLVVPITYVGMPSGGARRERAPSPGNEHRS